MTAKDIAYVELYASDERAMVDYFISRLGFAPVAECVDSRNNSTWLRQGTAQLVVTGGARTLEFLDEHGDGVADIAFACDEVGRTLKSALAAGAVMIRADPERPAVSGFGDVRHTLLAHSAEPYLPGQQSWAPLPAAPEQAARRIRLLDHVAVCVAGETLRDWVSFYTAGFGLRRYSSEYIEIGEQAMDSIVMRGPAAGVTFTFLEPVLTRSPGQIDEFLLSNGGPGVQHLAFRVDNIVSVVHEFRQRGVEFLNTPSAYYDLLMERLPDMGSEVADLRSADLLADRDEWGYLLQLFTRSPYERNTLFYELVERRGARGFGSANIKALYEAVERDRTADVTRKPSGLRAGR